LLDGGPATSAALSDSGKPKRKVSAAARRRMALAQKLRWKKLKQAGGSAQAEAAKPKRVLSARARKAISAAQKARGAVKKTAQKKFAKAGPTKGKTKTAGTPAQATVAGA